MVDPITATKYADVAAKLLPFAIRALKGAGKFKNEIEFDFQEAHIQYCTSILLRYCKARTFFVRDEPQYLEEFYIPTSLFVSSPRRSRERIARANLDSLRAVGPHIIVDGNGGSGKTVFMRYLMLDSIERGVAYPVLIELRRLNDDHGLSLEGAIIDYMLENGFPLGEEYARRALRQGQLVLLLDGYDEVNFSRRKKLVNEIRSLATSTECHIIISSRPDLTLEGWDQFSRVRMAPLELEEACELVGKISFDDDDEVKGRFISSLRSGLFESHKSFLSNPLLLSIMLLTYGHSADIPRRFSSFYERAYIALFEKHDAYKGYRRERETDLDISEFSSLFSAFSAITYDKGDFRFASTEAIEHAKLAKTLASVRNVPEEGFINDAKQAVCLLVDDGLDLAFVHRSFQEYFTAKYIQNADRKVQELLIRRYGSKSRAKYAVDNVLRYLYELSPTVVEELYLIPALSKVFGGVKRSKVSLTLWRSLFSAMFQSVHRANSEQRIGYVIAGTQAGNNLIALFDFVRDICDEAHHRRMTVNRDMDPALASLIDEEGSISLSSLSSRSPVWKMLAESETFFSRVDFDRMYAEFIAMKNRVEEKQATEELAFFAGSSQR